MKKRNVKLEISYDGTNYHGFQVQPNHNTIQGELEKAILKISKQQSVINGSGRTDAGVHARKQICNFYTDSTIPPERWKNALNTVLPDDIIILHSDEAPVDFHARYNVKNKTYQYVISNSKDINLFRRHYTWHYPYILDIEKMKEASKYFIGEHDFTSFSSAKTDKKNKIREIYSSELWVENNEIYFRINGNGFLYNMVRILTGTLVNIGSGKLRIDEMIELFDEPNRRKTGKTAPAKGLVLWDVEYE